MGKLLTGGQLKEMGINAYLTKPVKQSRLFDCLVSAVGEGASTDFDDSAVAASVSIPSGANEQLEKVRILVAEDDNINQRVALGQLGKLHYRADTVANGLEVLEALRLVPYDIILMDCQMPEMDGYEATRAIRKQEHSSEEICPWKSPVYIIAMTANAMQGDSEKCLAMGMNDYLSKPVQPSELQAALERSKLAIQIQIDRATTNGPINAPKSNTVDAAGSAACTVPRTQERCPVDMQRLREVSDDDPEQLRELVGLFLGQSEDLIKRLDAAIQRGVAKEITELAHNYVGVSASCGMIAIVPPLQELERMGRSGLLTGAEKSFADASHQLRRIRQFLVGYLEEI
jgi:CheY-like chemotaxis protein/HPt (histidine-containing phosphotransfer) domain-containing protein